MEPLLSKQFSSAGRAAVLSELAKASHPVSLNELSYRAKLSPFGASLVADSLVEAKLARELRRNSKRLLTLNPRHPDYDFIKQLFEEESRRVITQRADSYSSRAAEILSTVSQLTELIHRAQRT